MYHPLVKEFEIDGEASCSSVSSVGIYSDTTLVRIKRMLQKSETDGSGGIKTYQL